MQGSLADSLVLPCGAGLPTLASYLQTAASGTRSWKLQPETSTNANLMCQNIDKNMKTESGSAPAHFLKLVLLLTDSVRGGHRSTRRAPCWRLFRSTGPFPQPHGTIHKTRMLFPRCLFAHLKQTLLELKLPVVPRAGAGSLLRPPAPQEDTLCSERSGANLRQHQRAARCFSNLTSNEKRASCTDAITAASLGGGG